MICPHCEKDIEILPRAYINVENYQPHRAKVTTVCCGKLIVLKRRMSYQIEPYLGNAKEDDWGVKAY